MLDTNTLAMLVVQTPSNSKAGFKHTCVWYPVPGNKFVCRHSEAEALSALEYHAKMEPSFTLPDVDLLEFIRNEHNSYHDAITCIPDKTFNKIENKMQLLRENKGKSIQSIMPAAPSSSRDSFSPSKLLLIASTVAANVVNKLTPQLQRTENTTRFEAERTREAGKIQADRIVSAAQNNTNEIIAGQEKQGKRGEEHHKSIMEGMKANWKATFALGQNIFEMDEMNQTSIGELRQETIAARAAAEGAEAAAISADATACIVHRELGSLTDKIDSLSQPVRDLYSSLSKFLGEGDNLIDLATSIDKLREQLATPETDMEKAAAVLLSQPTVIGERIEPRTTRSGTKTSIAIVNEDDEKRVHAVQVIDKKIGKATAADVSKILASPGVAEALAFNLNPEKPEVRSSIVDLIQKYNQTHTEAFKPVAQACKGIKDGKVASLISGIESAEVSMVVRLPYTLMVPCPYDSRVRAPAGINRSDCFGSSSARCTCVAAHRVRCVHQHTSAMLVQVQGLHRSRCRSPARRSAERFGVACPYRAWGDERRPRLSRFRRCTAFEPNFGHDVRTRLCFMDTR